MAAEDTLECDVAVVGGGPAGLAAATELRRLGVASVVLLEREPEAGGIPRHCGHYPFGLRELGRVLRGPDYAARLVARARAAGVQVRTLTSLTALRAGPELDLSTPQGLARLRARRVLLATGVREKSRAQRFIGGDRPGGVLSTGALQGMVYLEGIAPFRRPVVLGSEFVSFSALLTCRHAGIRPVAMIEPNPRIDSWRGSSLLPRLMGVPLLLGTRLVRINGRTRVESVEVRGPDGSSRTLECDGVIVTGQFLPEATVVGESGLRVDGASGGPEVDQFGRLSDPDCYAAGNLLRPVETAGWSWSEGRAAGRMIARSLARPLPRPGEALQLRLAGEALRYAVPQRIVPSREAPALAAVQLRVSRPVRGELTVRHAGRTLYARSISALPERRILLPLWALPRGATGTAEIALEEGGP